MFPLFDAITEVYKRKIAIYIFMTGNTMLILILLLITAALHLPVDPNIGGIGHILTTKFFKPCFIRVYYSQLLLLLASALA